MKYLKTFESYNSVNEMSNIDRSKVKLLFSSISNSINDKSLLKDIDSFINMNVIDPYNTYSDILKGLQIKFPELEENPKTSHIFDDIRNNSSLT